MIQLGGIPWLANVPAHKEGLTAYQLVGGVTAHQGDDGYLA
jgi:hypothetical protein